MSELGCLRAGKSPKNLCYLRDSVFSRTMNGRHESWITSIYLGRYQVPRNIAISL